jgi:hypothetical protein
VISQRINILRSQNLSRTKEKFYQVILCFESKSRNLDRLVKSGKPKPMACHYQNSVFS